MLTIFRFDVRPGTNGHPAGVAAVFKSAFEAADLHLSPAPLVVAPIRPAPGTRRLLRAPARLQVRGSAEGGPSLDDEIVKLPLDRLPHLVGQLEDRSGIVGRIPGGVNRLAELNDPP
jgi:hypothetical protein